MLFAQLAYRHDGPAAEQPEISDLVLNSLIDQLPEAELSSAARYLQFLLAQESPVDPDMLVRIDSARSHPSPGIPHEDILREYGL